ncbi:MAG: cytochrome b/b6 domain-containing protein [Alphaproteobacteria bacterium]|nr:cytochrome b/b6 domain-containing protein [Alphaproteobacteria bacterium]
MNTLNRIRIYHATLAILAIFAFISGEMGVIHAWLGYGVGLVILLRLFWALSGDKHVGLMRFYPDIQGLKANNIFTHPVISKLLMLGIAISLVAVTGTGIAIDKGKAIGIANAQLIAPAYAEDDGEENEREETPLGETHEFFANMMLLFVGLHITYLLLFKLPLAKFMLFVPNAVDKRIK